jgi:predicted TIM-barrel fold metal-dependent hydrolase
MARQGATELTVSDCTIVDTDAHVTETVDDLLPYFDEQYSALERRIGNANHKLYDVYSVSHPTNPSIHSEFGDIYSEDNAPAQERHAKLSEMEQFDIDRAVLDPTLNLALNTVDNPQFQVALSNAYNDWILDTFTDHEEALKATAVVPPARPEEGAAEIDRVAGETDIVGVQIPSTGLVPPAGARTYDPIYEAASDHGLPVCFHGAASSTFHIFPTMRQFNNTYAEDHALVHPYTQMWQLTTLLYRGIPERFPTLEFVIQESGIGWIPYLLWRLDDHYMELSDDLPLLTKLPSEYVSESIYFTSQPLGLTAKRQKHLAMMLELAGPENVLYASDLPHADFDPPEELFDRVAPHFAESTVREMMGETASEVFGIAR